MTNNTSEQNTGNSKIFQQQDMLQIKDILYLCLSKWYWFLISLAICLGVATFKILRTPPIYNRSMSLMIKSDRRGKSVNSQIEMLSDNGFFSSATNANNEIISFKSATNMTEVVRRLKLYMDYSVDGKFHRHVLYGRSLPVDVDFIDFTEYDAASLDLVVKDSKVTLTALKRGGYDAGKDSKVAGNLCDTLQTPIGRVVVTPTVNYREDAGVIHVSRKTLPVASRNYQGKLSVGKADKEADIIKLSVTDISIQRAEDILNLIVGVYNENWIKDKNQIAVSTSHFINERLAVIEGELATVDNDISSYKKSNLLTDVSAASSMYMQQLSTMNGQILELSNQLAMTEYIRDYLVDAANRDQLIPANSGISSATIEKQIVDYNDMWLQRNNLIANSSKDNPLVVNLGKSLGNLRDAIIVSVDNQIVAIKTQIASLEKNEKKATNQIAASPTQAKYLLSVERQQKVKEALYIFLLQKREETELSQAFTAYNTRIIEPPVGSFGPVAPAKSKILLIALIIGLLIPLCVIYLREVLNTKLRGRRDLKDITIPFLGEIPLEYGSRKDLKALLHMKRVVKTSDVVVESGNRNVINEAFRVLRTNLEFMAKGNPTNVIASTSFNPGSGKTFMTLNLAVSLAIKGSRVLVIDADLRHASMSKHFGSAEKGISSYLSHHTDDYEQLIRKSEINENLYFLPVGKLPPNPTELISEPRFGSLIAEVRQRYDYIFLDCPPIDIVADTQIVEQQADRTIFVVRAGLLERSMLGELETLYTSHRFKNMCLVLNGTSSSGRYGYNYGYRYGYRYGYHSYGYHSYYGNSKNDK